MTTVQPDANRDFAGGKRISFDTNQLGEDRLRELEAWVRSVIGAVTDLVRPHGRIQLCGPRVCLILSQVMTDHWGNPIIDLHGTATMPLVIDLTGHPSWPAWLENGT